MSGVTWEQRSDNDWLASNGRWYPRSKYPSGWSMTSLPPAPEHANVGSILRRVTEQVVADSQRASDQSGSRISGSWSNPETSPRQTESQPPPTTHRAPAGPTSTNAGRAKASDRSFLPKEQRAGEPAEAKVVDQRTYTPKVAPGPPAPSALPPPPGRIRDAGHDADAPDSPSPPPPAIRNRAAPERTELEIVAGDLGKVLGVAKRRITRAINEAAEQGR